METVSAAPGRPTIAARWGALSSRHRRRIVLVSLFGVALAARDVMLLLAASATFALSELGATPRPRASPG